MLRLKYSIKLLTAISLTMLVNVSVTNPSDLLKGKKHQKTSYLSPLSTTIVKVLK